MAIMLNLDTATFKKNNAIAIILNNVSKENDEINMIEENDDFIFVFANKLLIGINIFNYSKYFENIPSGYHSLDENIKNYLVKNYSKYCNESTFESFIKIGKVINKNIHPNSEKLSVLDVKFSNKESQIITNVQDIEINKKYLFAINGATLANGIKIIESKVMNVVSQGMILSYKSIGQSKEGIVECNELSIEDEYYF